MESLKIPSRYAKMFGVDASKTYTMDEVIEIGFWHARFGENLVRVGPNLEEIGIPRVEDLAFFAQEADLRSFGKNTLNERQARLDLGCLVRDQPRAFMSDGVEHGGPCLRNLLVDRAQVLGPLGKEVERRCTQCADRACQADDPCQHQNASHVVGVLRRAHKSCWCPPFLDAFVQGYG